MVANHWGRIYILLTNPKCDFCEVEKAMFQGLVCHFELIFGLLANPKCGLGEDEKLCFKGSHGTQLILTSGLVEIAI